ncbi:hypothetical protein S83_008378, partial [Arachis hypogaea]
VIGKVVGKEDPRQLITSKGRETKRLAVILENLEKLYSKASNSARISHVSSHGDEGPTWIAGTIVSINVGKDDWFYKSCRKCPKKVDTPIDNRYECEKCGHTHGSASLRKTVQLCGRQAEQIKNEEAIDGEGYPPALDSMMDRRLLFKLNVKASNIKQYDHVYTVMKICDYEEIVEINHPKAVPNIAAATLTDGLKDSVTSLKSKTPAKRASVGLKQSMNININNEDEFGFSTNKFS